MFASMAARRMPECAFSGASPVDVEAWKQHAWPQVLATLGDFPDPVEPNPELIAEWEHDELRKQRWIIDVGHNISAICQINIPVALGESEKRPALLCWHGHGEFGKEPVMGNDTSPELRTDIEAMNYSYGHQMAKAGFVTFAIDWIGGGERCDGNKPHQSSRNAGRDWCNLYYLHATMFGMTSLSINVAHGKAATDFACTLPNVDSARLGVMGLSGGGTMALWSALCDDRLKAAEIICYSNLWAEFGIRALNYCGMQVAPGLYKLVDLPDLQGLLTPRPLLIDIGIHDECFRLESAMDCYQKLESIYKAAGADDALELDLFNGSHAWGGNKSVAFFLRHLEISASKEKRIP